MVTVRVASRMVAFGNKYVQDFDLNIDIRLVDVDDVAPPTVKLRDAKHHAPLLSSFLIGELIIFWC